MEGILKIWDPTKEITNDVDFYGMYSSNYKEFKFSIGERILINELKLYVRDIIKTKSIQYFAMTVCGRYSKTRWNFDGNGTFVIANVGRFFSHMQSLPTSTQNGAPTSVSTSILTNKQISVPTSTAIDEKKRLEQRLFDNLQKVLIANGVEKTDLEKFKCDDVKVEIANDDSIHGVICCALCSDKYQCRIPSKIRGEQVYWTLSNFRRHLNKSHDLVRTDSESQISKRAKSENSPNSKPQEKSHELLDMNNGDTNDEHRIENKTDMSENAMIHSEPNTADSTNVAEDVCDYVADSLEIKTPNSIIINALEDLPVQIEEVYTYVVCTDNDNIEGGNTTPINLQIETINTVELLVYKQISSQTLNMTEICMKYDDAMTTMNFELNDNICILDVAKIKADGQCLFSSLAHQLHGPKLDSEEHAKAAAQIRSDVIDFIKSNLNTFEHDIRGCIYHEKSKRVKKPGKIKDYEKEANAFLTKHLSKKSYWGGSESIKAVSLMYEVNVLIICEDSSAYFANGFESRFNRSLLLAYRLNSQHGHPNTGGLRNHYDSGINIHSDNLVDICDSLALMAFNQNIIHGPISIDD